MGKRGVAPFRLISDVSAHLTLRAYENRADVLGGVALSRALVISWARMALGPISISGDLNGAYRRGDERFGF